MMPDACAMLHAYNTIIIILLLYRVGYLISITSCTKGASIQYVRTQGGEGGLAKSVRSTMSLLVTVTSFCVREGGGGQKRPKFCVRTKWMLPQGPLLVVEVSTDQGRQPFLYLPPRVYWRTFFLTKFAGFSVDMCSVCDCTSGSEIIKT